jgi:hypothetical protein
VRLRTLGSSKNRAKLECLNLYTVDASQCEAEEEGAKRVPVLKRLSKEEVGGKHSLGRPHRCSSNLASAKD